MISSVISLYNSNSLLFEASITRTDFSASYDSQFPLWLLSLIRTDFNSALLLLITGDGDNIEDECNTCTCTDGSFECTKKHCSSLDNNGMKFWLWVLISDPSIYDFNFQKTCTCKLPCKFLDYVLKLLDYLLVTIRKCFQYSLFMLSSLTRLPFWKFTQHTILRYCNLRSCIIYLFFIFLFV